MSAAANYLPHAKRPEAILAPKVIARRLEDSVLGAAFAALVARLEEKSDKAAPSRLFRHKMLINLFCYMRPYSWKDNHAYSRWQ